MFTYHYDQLEYRQMMSPLVCLKHVTYNNFFRVRGHAPLLGPDDAPTSSSELDSWMGRVHLRFRPCELEGNDRGDSSSDLETEWGMLPPALIAPDLDWQCEQSSGIAAFSVSLSLADGIVARFGRVAMFSVFISVEECSRMPSKQKFLNKMLVPRINY